MPTLNTRLVTLIREDIGRIGIMQVMQIESTEVVDGEPVTVWVNGDGIALPHYRQINRGDDISDLSQANQDIIMFWFSKHPEV